MKSINASDNEDTHHQLQQAHSEPHRFYHTFEHVIDCLTELDKYDGQLGSREEVEVAIWFHDAIYDPKSTRNEIKSAEWAREFLKSCDMSDSCCSNVYQHIIATIHTSEPPKGDATLVVDIDLSILGSNAGKYDKFESDVRKEYEWVPWGIYSRKRSELLESFLSRPSIFRLEHFRERYEAQARRNLQSAIENLRK